ncbi:hypothetical protein ACIRJS_01565 [Streptomyces sp. NPDC102340]|uniref:hypothetical protein n=1 Tax=unclassified Streptomyces TaxID=2593676 RepID=UPI0037FCE4EB
MSTFVVIAVLVIAAAALVVIGHGRARGGGRGLKHRFGPEYDRSVALHDGYVPAAERELAERVKQYGPLKAKPLAPEARERYQAQWADLQSQFVESPQTAAAQADALLSHLAEERGFPGGGQFEEQMAALSVHHAHCAHGYRSMHTAARSRAGTEEIREAMLEARSLFEALVSEQPTDPPRSRPQSPDRGHAPWAQGRRQAKGSGTG